MEIFNFPNFPLVGAAAAAFRLPTFWLAIWFFWLLRRSGRLENFFEVLFFYAIRLCWNLMAEGGGRLYTVSIGRGRSWPPQRFHVMHQSFERRLLTHVSVTYIYKPYMKRKRRKRTRIARTGPQSRCHCLAHELNKTFDGREKPASLKKVGRRFRAVKGLYQMHRHTYGSDTKQFTWNRIHHAHERQWM